MQVVEVKRREIDEREFVKRSALPSDCSRLIREPCRIVDANTKETIAIYDKLPPEVTANLKEALRFLKYQTTERTNGLKTVSRIFGAMPRITLRSDFCRMASLNDEDPRTYALLKGVAAYLQAIYAEQAPERFARHEELTAKVLPEYRIGGSIFTSGIINKNNPLKYHYDAGNFDGVFSAMIGFKDAVLGGHLVFPAYDLMLEIGDSSISIFDGQEVLHGVTPIEKIREDAYRFTAVFYSLKQMWNCKPLTEELARIRRVKTERERKRSKKTV